MAAEHAPHDRRADGGRAWCMARRRGAGLMVGDPLGLTGFRPASISSRPPRRSRLIAASPGAPRRSSGRPFRRCQECKLAE